MKRLLFAGLFLFSSQIVSLAATDCDSCEHPLPQGCSSVCRDADAEGELVFYTSAGSEGQVQALVTEFEKAIPFLKVSWERRSSQTLVQKALAEHRLVRGVADVVLTLDTFAASLVEAGVFKTYRSPFWDSFHPAFRDSDGHWISPSINPIGVIYNTKLVRPNESPKALIDLLDPRWKGKIVAVSTDSLLPVGLVAIMGREKAAAYMKQLSTQNPVLVRDRRVAALEVASGKISLGLNYVSEAVHLARKGDPIAWILFKPAITRTYPMGIAASAPHPNAAKLFYDFILSPPGQKLLQEIGMIPANFKAAPTDYLRPLEPKDYRTIDVQNEDLINTAADVWQKVFLKR